MIIIIAAVAENNALGKNNDLLWHLPNDFKRFKEITSGHHIIMGRKTFESFPKPLPNRTHVIISRQKNYQPQGCIVVSDIKSAIEVCPKNDDTFIIGGGEIYKQSINLADKLDITLVHKSFDADVYFPEIDAEIWELESETNNSKDEKHPYDYTFQTFIRKK
jgi:dihydrofolate reductase